MTTELPDALNDLREQLESHGYWMAEERSDDDHFGDRLFVMMKEGLGVRIVRDRGQWFIDASGPGLEDWFSPMVWQSYLSGDVGDTRTPTVSEQAQLLLKNLDNMVEALQQDRDLLAHLRNRRSTRASVRRAAPPSSP